MINTFKNFSFLFCFVVILFSCEQIHPIEKDHAAELSKLWNEIKSIDEHISSWGTESNKEETINQLAENHLNYKKNYKAFFSKIPKENQDSLKLYVDAKSETTLTAYANVISNYYGNKLEPKIKELKKITDGIYFEEYLNTNLEGAKDFVQKNNLANKIKSLDQLDLKLNNACPPKYLKDVFENETSKQFDLVKARTSTLKAIGAYENNVKSEYYLEGAKLDSCFKNMVVLIDNIIIILQKNLNAADQVKDKDSKAKELAKILSPMRRQQIEYYKVFKNNFTKENMKHFKLTSDKNKILLRLFNELEVKGININQYAQ